jgi:hypothetical protein
LKLLLSHMSTYTTTVSSAIGPRRLRALPEGIEAFPVPYAEWKLSWRSARKSAGKSGENRKKTESEVSTQVLKPTPTG